MRRSRIPADTATLRPVCGANQRHELQDALHGPLVGTAHRQHDAELAGPERRGLAGRREHLVGVEERRGQHRRVEAGRLGAEVAVLGAAAGLGGQDALDLDAVAAPGQANLVGQGGEARRRLWRQCRQRRQLGLVERSPLVDERRAGGLQGRTEVGGEHEVTLTEPIAKAHLPRQLERPAPAPRLRPSPAGGPFGRGAAGVAASTRGAPGAADAGADQGGRADGVGRA